MCSCNLYFKNELVMEDVIFVKKENNKIIAYDLFGEKKEFEGDIKIVDLNNNKIYIE
ncbi:RNA-binding protein [Methanocaldococcus villosus KIN24-T80]|uniref:RNA-binding protein n=1 Tax=Methanocaldococcus villosus KIN24-T80 TaxID=1069083 RepID=N6V1H2_9EURY|nr:CooT family nickel-binding protein [Methanocaldococcus villosus]ENN96118.1 RNA-binding protein [Methanocaldococcus villosus KIN24-T80]